MGSPTKKTSGIELGLAAVGVAMLAAHLLTGHGVFWLGWLVLGGVWLWCNRDQLGGPILWYDLVRRARGGRQLLHRSAFGAILLGMFYLAYTDQFGDRGFANLFSTTPLQAKNVQRFANDLFQRAMLVQLLFAWLATPLLTAGALSEERERKTLDLLFTTDLNAREIVFGKLAGGVGFMFQLVLTSLPILTLLVLLGGVAPEHVLAGFLLTLMLIVTATSGSLAISADATSTTAALLVSFLMALPLALFCVGIPIGFLESGRIWAGVGFVVLAQILLSFLMLNIALRKVRPTESAAPLPKVLSGETQDEEAVRPAGTVREGDAIRPVTMVAGGRVTRFVRLPPNQAAIKPVTRRLPPIGKQPMIWKECYVEEISATGELAKLVKGLAMVLAGLFILMLPFYIYRALRPLPDHLSWTRETLAKELSGFTTFLVTALTIAWLGSIMLVAAGTITREREAKTLESLLASPLTRKEILRAKLIGSLYIGRWIGYCLVGMLAVGLITSALHPLSILGLVVGTAIWSIFFVCLGLWFSVRCQTTTRAVLFTTISGLLVMIAPLALAGPISRPMAAMIPRPQYQYERDHVKEVEGFLNSLSPGAATTVLVVPPHAKALEAHFGLAVLTSWVICLVAAAAMWNETRRQLTRAEPH